MPLRKQEPMTMHEGHRHRLRERFRREGLENFEPHEVLELLLFYARARGDVNPLAHALLDAFGSLRGVLEAPVEQLMAVHGVGEETATLIAAMVPMFRRYELCICEERKRLRNCGEVKEYCRALLTGLRKERFYVLSVSTQMRLIGQRIVAEGSLSEVAAYPRQVVETALNHNAYGVILCHNHPGGDVRPSVGDVDVTRNLEMVLSRLGIVLIDHIIVSDGQVYSMMEHKDFTCSIIARTSSLQEDDPWDGQWPE